MEAGGVRQALSAIGLLRHGCLFAWASAGQRGGKVRAAWCSNCGGEVDERQLDGVEVLQADASPSDEAVHVYTDRA